MAGALKAGGIYVAVTAAIGEFTKTLGAVIKGVEDTAKRVKESAKGIAEIGTLFAAAMGGAVLAASQSNRAIQADVERLKGYLYTLAADLGDAFGPFLQQLTRALGSVVGAFQRLSPELKEGIAQFVVLGASVGAGATVLAKGVGVVEAVAKVSGLVLLPALQGASTAALALGEASKAAFPSLGKAAAGMEAGIGQSLAKVALSFGSVLLPIAAVAAAVGGIILLAAAVYQAWNDSSSGMKAAMASAWESIKALGGKLADALAGWWEALKGFLVASLRTLLEVVALQVRKVSGLLAPLAHGLGLDKLSATFEDLQHLTGDALLKDLQAGASFLADKASQAGQTLKEGAQVVGRELRDSAEYTARYLGKGLKGLARDTGLEGLPERLKAALGGVLDGPAGKVRAPLEPVEAGSVTSGIAVELPQAVREFQSGMSNAMRARLDSMKEQAKRLAEDTAAALKAARALAQETAERIAAARAALVSRFKSAFGELSEMVDAFKQGFEAGGIWGAIVAVVAELLLKSQQFAHLIEVTNGVVGMAADAVGKLAEPFIPLTGAVSVLLRAGLDGLTPLFEMLNAGVSQLVPPLVLLGELFQALAPVTTLLGQATMLMLNPLQLLAGPVMKALFEVLKRVAVVILTVVKAVAGVWNGIVGAIQSVLRTLADISILGAKPLSFLDGWADGLDSAIISTDALNRSLKALNGLTWESAQEKAKETAEVVRNRRAVEKATESLSNVPSAWKYALARFESQDAQQGPIPPGGGGVAVPPAPPPPSGGGGPWGPRQPGGSTTPGQPPPGQPVIDTVNINVGTLADALERLERFTDKLYQRNTGSRGRPGRYAVPGG